MEESVTGSSCKIGRKSNESLGKKNAYEKLFYIAVQGKNYGRSYNSDK